MSRGVMPFSENPHAARCDGIDADDLINFRTVNALVARGFIVIDPAGTEARLADGVSDR